MKVVEITRKYIRSTHTNYLFLNNDVSDVDYAVEEFLKKRFSYDFNYSWGWEIILKL